MLHVLARASSFKGAAAPDCIHLPSHSPRLGALWSFRTQAAHEAKQSFFIIPTPTPCIAPTREIRAQQGEAARESETTVSATAVAVLSPASLHLQAAGEHRLSSSRSERGSACVARRASLNKKRRRGEGNSHSQHHESYLNFLQVKGSSHR